MIFFVGVFLIAANSAALGNKLPADVVSALCALSWLSFVVAILHDVVYCDEGEDK